MIRSHGTRFRTLVGLSIAMGLSVVGSASAQSVAQGPIVNPANGHTYYRLTNSNWTDAQNFAVNNLGGHLVTINDAAENTFVLNTFANAPGSGRVWLGLNDAANEGNFVWVSGQASGFTNWEPGEPNNSNNEDYVAMYSGNGRWVDVMNLANPPGIGNVYGVVEVEAAPCPTITVAQGPIVNPANGHTYYRLSNSNWTCAENYAVNSLNGHLVSINDAAENDFVLNTFANAPGSGRVWLGLNDAANEGTFVYSNGDSFSYSNWEPGEPNNSNNEDYVAMYSGNGRWVDVMDLANPPGIGNIYGVVEVPTVPGPPNDNCANATTIAAYGMTPFDNTAATTDGPTACGLMANDLWYRYTACASGDHNLTTCSLANYDTVLAIYTGSCGSLTEVACLDDSCNLQTSLTWSATAGTTYLLRVGGFNGRTGSGTFALSGPTCGPPCPTITVVQGPITSPGGHRYYRLSNSNWTCAEAFAVTLRGHLVSINSAAENDFVLNTFANAPGSGRVWLGLNDAANEGTFVYSNGDSFSYSNWEPGEPNNSNNEDYVAMYSGNGRWVDVMDLANPPGIGEIYGVVEVSFCPADLDDGSGTGTPDGGVTIDDLLYYLSLYAAGNIGADLDDGSGTGVPDGGVTIDDLLYFLDRYASGC